MPSGDKYLALLERLRSYDLPAETVADIETYRRCCEQSAYEIGCVNAQMVLKVPVAEIFATTPFNPFVEA
jgi:hypothetical protein